MPDFTFRRRDFSPSKVKVYVDETTGSTTAITETFSTNSLIKSTGLKRSGTDAKTRVTNVDIYYGSTTGTSEKYAHIFARAIGNHGIQTSVYCLSTFDPELMTAPNRVSIFVVSTHGEGGPSETAQRFYDWLQAELKGKSSLSTTTPEVKAAFKRTGSVSPLSFIMRVKEEYEKKKQRKKRLKGMKYAVFGIGSTAYINYNAMGIFVDNSLNQLGATRLCKIGLGDSLLDPEEDYLIWQFKMLKIFPPPPPLSSSLTTTIITTINSKDQPLDITSAGVHDIVVVSSSSSPSLPRKTSSIRLLYSCHLMTHEEAKSLKSSNNDLTCGYGNSKASSFFTPCMVHLHSIELLYGCSTSSATTTTTSTTTNPMNNAILLNIAIENENIRYEAADNFALFPHNSSEMVEAIALRFRYDLDRWFHLELNNTMNEIEEDHCTTTTTIGSEKQLPFPTPCSIRKALTEYLELSSVTREFMRLAAEYVEVDKERDLVEHLASIDGSNEFNERFLRQKNKGLLDFFDLCPSLKLPFEVFVNIVSLIKPRLYTIANSPKLFPRNIQLVISQPTPPVGLTTCYVTQLLTDKLSSCCCGSISIRGFVTASNFRLPSDKSAPIIMIGNGVGIAPMRAMLQHRDIEQEQRPVLNYLFYGCRDQESILFQEELDQWQSKGLVEIHFGFSRDLNYPNQYVQDIVAQYLQEIHDMVIKHPHARIYVCGKSEMARKVRQVLSSSSSSSSSSNRCSTSSSSSSTNSSNRNSGHTRQEAWFDELLRTGRYIEEAWG